MQLTLDTVLNTICDAEGNTLEFGRSYPMPDGEHTFVVRESDAYLVAIKKDGQTVQSAKIHNGLSAAAGQGLNGDHRVQSYVLDLDPARPIWPINDLIKKLLSLGIDSYSISPMFDPALSDCVPSHSSPHVLSDVPVRRWERPSVGDRLTTSEFTVREATWAIRYFEEAGELHVYLWMGAAETLETVLDAVRRIKAGELTPEYV